MRIARFILPTLLFLTFLLPFVNTLRVKYIDGHDFLLHFQMIYTLEEYIRNGVILPRILPQATYGYGSPILTFMWGVPYYAGVFLHMLGLNYPDVFKLLIILPTIISGLGMYLWIKSLYGKWAGIVASVVYVWVPYRFVNSFIRGAIGELFFFGFFPFIMYFLSFAENKKNQILGIICCALMIYSHQGMSLVGYALFIIYILFRYILEKNRDLFFRQLYILVGGLLLSAFYWIPAIYYHSLLPFGDSIGKEWFPPLLSLLRSPWEGGMSSGRWLIFSYQIGIAQLFIIFCAHLLFFNFLLKKKRGKLWLGFWLIIFWGAIFFLQPVSYLAWINIPLIAYLQFSFRLLFIPMLVSAVLIGILFKYLRGNKKYLLGIFIIILALYANRNHLGILEKQVNVKDIANYRGTYDVGGEKLPYYVNLREIEKENEKKIGESEFRIIEGEGKIRTQRREDFYSFAEISMEEKGVVKIRRIYFPGWELYINEGKIPEEKIVKGNGIFIPLSKGANRIILSYKNPLVVVIAEIISVCFLVFIIVSFSFNRLNPRGIKIVKRERF